MRILDANAMRTSIQLNWRNIYALSLFKIWLVIEYIVLFSSISILKLQYIQFKNRSKLSQKTESNVTKWKCFTNTFFRKISGVSLSNKWAGYFFEDDSSCCLWIFSDGETEWNSIGGEYESK